MPANNKLPGTQSYHSKVGNHLPEEAQSNKGLCPRLNFCGWHEVGVIGFVPHEYLVAPEQFLEKPIHVQAHIGNHG